MTPLLIKAKKVINSIQTIEQATVAMNYLDLVSRDILVNSKGETYDKQTQYLSEVAKLFNIVHNKLIGTQA